MNKLPQGQLGFGGLVGSLKQGLASLLGRGRVKRLSPLAQERIRFSTEAHEQLVKLKEKGINIPVFTL